MSENFDEFQQAPSEWDEFQQAGPSTRDVLKAVSKIQPEQAAKAAQLAKKFNAPDAVLLRTLQDAEAVDAINRATEKLGKAPSLSEYLRRSPFVAAQAQKDIDPLVEIESGMGALSGAGLAQATLGISESIWRTPDAAQRLVGYVAGQVERTGLPQYLNPIRGVQDFIRIISEGRLPIGPKFMAGTTDAANKIADAQDLLTERATFGDAFADLATLGQNADKALEVALKDGNAEPLAQVLTSPEYWTAMLAQAAPSLYAAVKSGGSSAFLVWMEGMEQASNAAEFEARTGIKISDSEFSQSVLQTALINGWLEKSGLEKVMGAGGKGLKGVVSAAFSEGSTEALQQVNSNLAALLAYDDGKNLLEGVVSSFMGGAGSGGSFATAQSAAEAAQDVVAKRNEQAARTKSDASKLQNLMAAAAQATLRENNPETFAQLVQHLANNQEGAPQTLYIDAQVLMQSTTREQLAQLLPSAVAQLEDAAATNATLELPIGEIMAAVPGTPLEQIFLQNVRTAPDALSLAEVQQQGEQAADFIKNEADRVLQQAQDQATWQASSEAVKATILDQLTRAGRFNADVNEAYAALQMNFFSTMAARLGVTPQELYDRFSLKVAGASQATGPVLNAGNKPGELTVEGYHYSKAARPTISTRFFGAGLKGSNRDLYLNAADTRLRNRAYFYVDKGTGINPEAGVGGVAQRANLSNIYDSDADPLKLKRGADQLAFESAVLDAGFSGYLARMEGTQSGQVILLGDQAVQAEVLGPVGRIPAGQRVPALPRQEPQWQVQASGTPEQLQARLERMQSSPAWADYDLRIEGRELQVRKKEVVFEQSGRSGGDTTFADRARQLLDSKPASPLSTIDIADGKVEAPSFANITELAAYFTKKNRSKVKDLSDPKTQAKIADAIYAETLHGLTDAGNAIGWYDRKTKAALAIVTEVHPELATDEQSRFAFIALLAVTSNGLRSRDNFVIAEQLYREGWKVDGKFPESVPQGGPRAVAMGETFALLNRKVEELGWQAVRDFMSTKHTAKEVRDFAGATSFFGEQATSEVPGALFLGPKLGSFFNNLYGDFSTVTMDRWFMRTMNRVRGRMLSLPSSFGKNLGVLRQQIESGVDTYGVKPGKILADIAAFELMSPEQQGDVLYVRSKLKSLQQYVRARHRDYAKPKDDGTGKKRSFLERTPENYLAKNLDLAMSGSNDAPFNATDRTWIRGVMDQVQDRLKADGIDITNADLQAVLWYYEKDLYARLIGGGQDVETEAETQETQEKEAEDYETAARYAVARLQQQGLVAGPARPARPGDGAGRAGGDTRVNFEVAPDPNNAELTARWRELTEEQRLAASQRVADTVVPAILDQLGAKGRVLPQIGSYLEDTNPSFALQVLEGDPVQIANVLGFALSQDSMMVFGSEEFPGSFSTGAVRVDLSEVPPDQVDAIYQALRNIKVGDEQPVGGQSTSGGVMSVLNFSSVPTEELARLVDSALGGRYDVTFGDIYAAFPEKDNYDYARETDDPAGEEGLARQRARAARQEASAALEIELSGRAAPTGEYAQAVDVTQTPEFKAWSKGLPVYEDSAGVTARGIYKVYHATRGDHDILTPGGSDPTLSGPAIWLSPHAEHQAAMHNVMGRGGFREGTNVRPLYARVERPLVIDDKTMLEWARDVFANGSMEFPQLISPEARTEVLKEYDSIVLDGQALGWGDNAGEVIVFDSTQLKSAIGNDGTFDADDPSTLSQGPRGTFNPQSLLITLNENADLSTFLHESGHFFLEVMADLASAPDAPQQIRDDMAQVLKWFGVPDLATWNGYTLDQKRKYHERWAESFEQYLLEGKAPSAELQPLFRRFRSWLVNVYKSLTEFMRGRNLKVSDEIRQVFDRMLATDDQIAAAEQAAGLMPDFDATNEAIEKLTSRSLRDLKWTVNARSKAIKELQKQARSLRKAIEEEVRAEVDEMPEMKAKAALEAMRKAEKRTPTDLEMAIIAEANGYRSADEMLQAIDAFGKKADVIEGLTSQRMLERHGDLVDERAIEEAANEAVHNEARARSLATELKSQSEMLNPRQDTGRTASNGRAITVNAIAAAAKEFAANLAARRRIKDLKSAAAQHRAAEARAGKAWQEATAKGKTQEAVQAKRDQVLNNAAVKALVEAQAEVKKIGEFFAKVTKGNNEKLVERGRDPDVVNAMRAILGAYDVAPRLEKSALEYMETVGRNDPAMYAALKPGVDAALFNAKPMREMTMEELRGLHDELRAMWHLAKRSRQMEVDGNLLDIEDAADQLLARMGEIGIPAEIPGEKGAITDRQERGIKLQFAKAILSRVEQWAERLDGEFGGPFLRLVFQPIKDAADRYRTDKVAYRKKFTSLVDSIAPILPPGPVEAPELGYTFGNARDSGVAELLHAILHTGNDSNKRKLLLGRNWASENPDGTLDTARWDAFIARMISEGKLEKAHYDFAQGVWDLLEEMKPLAQETHRKVFGRYFAEVTANEVVTPFGTYRGGYVPAQTDSRIVKDAKLRELAEGENESMAYAFPAAPSGFTKSRVEYNQPLLLDLRALGQHMDKVLLFSHMQGAVTDVRRLLTNKRVSYALDRIDPGAYEGMLTPWLNRAAKQIVETPVVGDRKLSRFLSAARSRAGMALMFANLSNTVQQITGFSLAAVKVKPGLMMKAAAQFVASPKEMKTAVADASAFMKDRMLNEVGALNDVIEEILVNPTLLERGQTWTQRHAYFLQTAVDNTMSPIIWTAAYNQAIEEGMAAKDAVRFADGVIRQTQGTSLPEDISRFESGPAYGRLFTQFVGYFNMMANTNATAVKQIVDEMGVRKGAGKLLYVALAGLLVPIWVAEIIALGFRGGPEDEDDDGWLDDWLAAVFGLGTIRGLVAQVPLVGQAAQLVVNRFNDNPADDKFSLSPAVSLIESTVSAPASVYKAIVEDGNKQKALRDTAAAATMLTGLPFYAAARPLGYAAGVADDRIDPTGPLDLTRGLVTGTASPESKQP